MPDLDLNWRLRSALRERHFGFGLESITATVDGDDFGMMQQTVEDRAGGRDIAEQFTPFFDGSIRGHHGGSVLVTTHDDFQEDLAAFLRQDFESHIVN